MLEIGGMLFRQNPRLKWKSWRKGADHHEVLILADDPGSLLQLLSHNVTVNAAFLVSVVFLGSRELVNNIARNNGQGDKLGMGMLQGGAGRSALIFENQDIAKAFVLSKIQDPVPVGPDDLFKLLLA